MCFPKNKKGRPTVAPVKSNSVRATPTQKRAADLSQKKISSAPARCPAAQPAAAPVEPESSNKEKEKTCVEDKSDAMAISLYKEKKKKEKEKEEGSGGGHVAKPADERVDSPEVFENNAQVVSLNPINVTQIFVDSVIPQTNVSKQHTDIVDQNTLETVDPNMDDMVYDRLDSSEEQFPELPQPRPAANVLQPEDETIVDNTMSERATKPSEKRATRNVPRPGQNVSSGLPSDKRATRTIVRTEHRQPTTPERIPSVFTPQAPTKSEKMVYTGKRGPPRGQISTRTAALSRPRPSGARTPPNGDHVAIDNTCPSHEPLTNRAHRHQSPQAPATEYRTVVQTAIAPVDSTIGSREPTDTATAKKTNNVPGPTSMIYTAHFKDP